MTRIISGEFRGRRLSVPDTGTRPTTDRVREALFSIVGARVDVDGLRVLDLYAGSGALGLEALSRGAAYATFVDDRRRATATITANLTSLDCTGRARVVTAAAVDFLATEPSECFDLVVLDPPYTRDGALVAAELERIARVWLSDDGLLVVERDARSAPLSAPDGVEVLVDKTYGETRIKVMRHE